jgi:molybdopterin converting factor small subunit
MFWSPAMSVTVCFYSYVKDLTGSSQAMEDLPAGATLGDLFKKLALRFPKLAAMEKSLLLAVGVDYQPRSYVLKEGDEVSLFPPVQGG